MAYKPVYNSKNFWRHPYIHQLPPHGRFVFGYLFFSYDLPTTNYVILEDICSATSAEASEVRDWFELFKRQGQLPTHMELV